MIRTVVLSLALVAATAGAAKAPPKPTSAPAVAKSPDAPADEYFGPFKYSAISVRMKINALGRSYHERWSDDASIVHDALLVESSYRAWAQKYPKDRWLAPTAYHLAQLYQDVQTQDARSHARAMYDFLVKNFPASKEAHSARIRLSGGFPALHAESPVSRTPSPYGTASPVPGASPTAPPATPSAGPSAVASPAASPKPSASP
ncbi:MAG: hypothetical protein QOF71_962 [Candidatus Eremiobacteraeota bacterium]|jgi:hypothetical protein|nr:hypothetical protein [Candidatus Eremiobacteraeota bacterium]